MDVVEFAKQVKMMRDFQNEYFANRTQTNLFNAKQQERYVDDLTEGVLNPDAPITQLNMFKVEDLSVKFERMTSEEDFLWDSYIVPHKDGDPQGAYGIMKRNGLPVIHIYDLPENRIYFLPAKEILDLIQRLAR